MGRNYQAVPTPQSHPNIKALKGDYAGYYRYRIGEYRLTLSLSLDTEIL